MREIASAGDKLRLQLQTARLVAEAADRIRFENIDKDNFLLILAPVSGVITDVTSTQPGDKIQANTPLPVVRTEEQFGTILADQESVRIQVYEQAGPTLSPEIGHNRRVLDGELTKIGSLPAGSVIRITIPSTSTAISSRGAVIEVISEQARCSRLAASRRFGDVAS